MFMVMPHWEIFARIDENDHRHMAEWVKLICSDEDFEAVIRSLKRSGYSRFEMVRKRPGADDLSAELRQTVED